MMGGSKTAWLAPWDQGLVVSAGDHPAEGQAPDLQSVMVIAATKSEYAPFVASVKLATGGSLLLSSHGSSN